MGKRLIHDLGQAFRDEDLYLLPFVVEDAVDTKVEVSTVKLKKGAKQPLKLLQFRLAC
jgi:hypothetical protein